MPASLHDHSLLFAALAQQHGVVPLSTLLEALRACREGRTSTVRDFLTAGSRANPRLLDALEDLARHALARHGDVLRALAAVPAFAELRPHLVDLVAGDTLPPRPTAALPTVDAPAPPAGEGDRPEATLATGNALVAASARSASTEPAPTPAASVARAAAPVRFRTLRLLGRGGLGEVFVAHDEELQREVALKEIQARHLGHAESRERFVLEAELTGRLEHPGIVPVYGLGTYADGRPFYAMRFIKGESLKDAIARFHARTDRSARADALELRQLLGRFVALCNAIAYAHSRGVLHRDIKPDNVMLGEFGETLVVDWGLAKRLGTKDETLATVAVSVDDQEQSRQRRMRVGLALLPSDPQAVRDELLAWMLATDDPRELELTRNVLEPHKAISRDRLWSMVADQPAKSPVRFRALVALALFDPEDARWTEAAPGVLEAWLRADPLYFGVLTRALQPARRHLIAPLAKVAKGQDTDLLPKRYEAASVLALYAADQTETLVDVLVESDERQFGLLLPRVQARGEEALVVLQRELERPPAQTVAERDSQAVRQSTAGLALLRLGRAESVWPLLKHSADPTRRTYLTLRLASRGVEARLLVERLEQTPEVSERRALLSALGEYDGEQLPADLRGRLVPRLLGWYRDDPDPGIHGTIDWLLRHGQEGPVARKLDWGQAEALAAIDGSLACSYRRRPLERENGPEGRGWSVNGKGMTLVHFRGPVEFQMGSPLWEADRIPGDEIPHRRRIERSFGLCSRKVTVREFEAFRQPYQIYHQYTEKYSPEPECPITTITWWDAAQFCRWLSEEEGFPEGEMVYPSIAELEKCKKDPTKTLNLPVDHLSRKGYRLPTEAEWEYACRAGATTAHYYGDGGEDLLRVYAWFEKNSQTRSWPVGQKRPNDFGLFDMHGNTWDWCQESSWRYAVPANGLIVDEEDKRYKG